MRFQAGACLYRDPGIVYRAPDYSDDFRVIEITTPADFELANLAR